MQKISPISNSSPALTPDCKVTVYNSTTSSCNNRKRSYEGMLIFDISNICLHTLRATCFYLVPQLNHLDTIVNNIFPFSIPMQSFMVLSQAILARKFR